MSTEIANKIAIVLLIIAILELVFVLFIFPFILRRMTQKTIKKIDERANRIMREWKSKN